MLSAPELVAEATRARVMAAVARLGYAPNVAAKSLRTLRTEKILVTVPDISNPFFSQVIRGVEEAAQAAGYSVLLGDTRHEAEREEQYAAMLRRKEADGLIFLGHRLPETLAEMVARAWGRARRSSTAASSAPTWASPAPTSTTSAPPPRRWSTSTAWATAASA